jgi:hypothetical protein
MKVSKFDLRVDRLDVDDCVPMAELERQYYDPSNFHKLKMMIEEQGQKKCYAIRVIWNEELQKYEIFCGIHRWKAVKALGHVDWIYAINETGMISRELAIAEGINDNSTHASYNPMDLAIHLKIEGDILAKMQKHKGAGRPSKYRLDILSKKHMMSESHIGNLIQMNGFPEEVKDLIGLGKLRLRFAFVFERLLDTPQESLIGRLAQSCVENNWDYATTKGNVSNVIKGGSFTEGNIECVGCGDKLPKNELRFKPYCPKCLAQLKKKRPESSGETRIPRTDEDRKEFMLKSENKRSFCGKVKTCKIGCQYCRHYWIARGVIGEDAENMVKALVNRTNVKL